MRVYNEKATAIFDRLIKAYSSKEYPFNLPDATPPQIPGNLPHSLKTGTREHAMFLFKLCYWMRGGIQSHTATKQLSRLYDASPRIFLPEAWTDLNAPLLAAMFRLFGLGFNADEISKAWISNLKKIAEEWGGDPRNLFQGIGTFEEACERIQHKRKNGFLGFQEKMVSMIIYFYMDAAIVDPWNFPIPVDFHALRTLFAHEIIVADKSEFNGNGFYTKTVLAKARELFHDYCATHGVDPLVLCEAVWLYSGIMCNQHPGNQSNVGGRHGRKTELHPVDRWSAAQSKTYERTCRICVINASCKWCVPSAEYYIRGRLVLRERRDEPLQESLFPIFK